MPDYVFRSENHTAAPNDTFGAGQISVVCVCWGEIKPRTPDIIRDCGVRVQHIVKLLFVHVQCQEPLTARALPLHANRFAV